MNLLPQVLAGYPELRCGWGEGGVLGHELTIMGIRQVQWQGQPSGAWEWALQDASLTRDLRGPPTLSTPAPYTTVHPGHGSTTLSPDYTLMVEAHSRL